MGDWVSDYRPFLHWYTHDLAPALQRWVEEKEHKDFLLPKSMVEEAKKWLDKYPDKLSGSLETYIRESIAAQQRRQRWKALVLAGIVVISLVAALVFGWQRNVAIEQANLALSRQLAAQALNHQDDQPDLAVLLSLAANSIADTVEARGSLLDTLGYNRHLITYLRGHSDLVLGVAFSPRDRILATAGWDKTIIL